MLRSKYRFETFNPKARRIVDPVDTAEPVYTGPTRADVEALSDGDLLALLNMSRTQRSSALWQALRERYSAPPFTLSNFVALRDLGYADKPDGEKYHRLTTNGFRAADHARDILQERYRVHAAYVGGYSGAIATVFCTCGWLCSINRGSHLQANAVRAHAKHLKTVNAVSDLATALVPRHLGAEREEEG